MGTDTKFTAEISARPLCVMEMLLVLLLFCLKNLLELMMLLWKTLLFTACAGDVVKNVLGIPNSTFGCRGITSDRAWSSIALCVAHQGLRWGFKDEIVALHVLLTEQTSWSKGEHFKSDSKKVLMLVIPILWKYVFSSLGNWVIRAIVNFNRGCRCLVHLKSQH